MLRATLQAEQHLSLHHEVREFDEQGVGDVSRPARHAAADDEPCAIPGQRLEDERAPPFERQGAERLEARDGLAVARMEQDLVSRRAVLPFRVDAVGIVDAAAGRFSSHA
jgi:hypothetical protein